MMNPEKVRTKINTRASSLALALKSPRSPPPSLALVNVASPFKKIGRRRKGERRRNYPHTQTAYCAVKYHYHPITSNVSEGVSRYVEEEDCRTFIDWLFLRHFRCKRVVGNDPSPAMNCIATIFSMEGMPSAAELLCGSIEGALTLERALASTAGIVSDGNGIGLEKMAPKHQRYLAGVSFRVGSAPVIRYTNGKKSVFPIGQSVGIVSEEAFNTVKRICGFKNYTDAGERQHIFTKDEVACPIRNTHHHVELRGAPKKEEIIFCMGRRQIDVEGQTIIADACHRFLETSADNTFQLLIVGPPASGKTSALREFRNTLSSSNGFHQWNIINGNEFAKYVSTDTTQALSSCVLSYVKEVISNDFGKEKKNLPYVILFDDLSLEQGLPMTQQLTNYGIHVIATIGSGHTTKNDACQLTKYFAQSTSVLVKTMVLELSPDDDCSHHGTVSSSKRKQGLIKSRYKFVTFGTSNHSKRRKL